MRADSEVSESSAAGTTSRVRAALLPTDRRQALRIRRYLMAAGTALLVMAVLLVCAWLGLIPWQVARRDAVIIVVLIVVFYALFRFGINMHFADPSLTTELIGASILMLAFILSQAPQLRGTLMILYLVALMFGVLRLVTGRLLALSALTFLAHAVVVWLALGDPDGNDPSHVETGIAELVILAVVLPWFAFMGGYVNKLRSRLSDTNRNLTAAVDRIEQLAIRDVLTGVYNRRHLVDALERERARAVRLGSALSICLFDIDHFKSVNDTYGHACGDAVLKHFSLLVNQETRANDVFGRYGGEEFLMILPDTELQGANAVARRALDRVSGAPFPAVPSDHRVTATAGVVRLLAGEEVEALIARADKALYAGKEGGRNRTVLG